MIKQYNYLILFITLSLLTACGWNFDEDEKDRIGIGFEISNNYPADIEGAKIVIGGINELDTFIAMDTFNLPTIKINSRTDLSSQLINLKNRWNPDFDEIKAISDKAYFKAVLSNGNNHLIEDSALNEFSSINL